MQINNNYRDIYLSLNKIDNIKNKKENEYSINVLSELFQKLDISSDGNLESQLILLKKKIDHIKNTDDSLDYNNDMESIELVKDQVNIIFDQIINGIVKDPVNAQLSDIESQLLEVNISDRIFTHQENLLSYTAIG